MPDNKIIYAGDLLQAIRDDHSINGANFAKVRRHIEAAKAVEVKPVVHGRWITHNKGSNNWVECSRCNTVGSPFWKCCPMCEAKMEGGKTHE